MSTFSITENPSQVYLGDQSTVSLVNDGPFTVYFDENTSVDSSNGFELPPTGQMTWKGNKPLFARTATLVSGALPAGFATSARLRTTISGELSLTTRAKFYKPLSINPPFPTPSSGRICVESGHCQSLIVTYTASIADVTGAGPLNFQTLWYDESFNLLTSEIWTAQFAIPGVGAGSAPPNAGNLPTWRTIIPVKGKYCVILPAFIPTPTLTCRVIGTDSILPPKCDAGVSYTGGASVTNFSYNGRTLTFDWTGVGVITIPGNGMDVIFGISNPGAAVSIVIGEVITAKRVGLITVPPGSDIYSSFNLPINTNYTLSVVGAGLTANILIAWPAVTINS